MAEIIQFSKFREHKACVAATPSLVANNDNDQFNFNELAELQDVFAIGKPMTLATKKALYTEAMEQAHIEMHGGPIDLSTLPPLLTKPAVTANDVRQLRLMVEKTRECLAEYLMYFKSTNRIG
jgi:hypothetical protein